MAARITEECDDEDEGGDTFPSDATWRFGPSGTVGAGDRRRSSMVPDFLLNLKTQRRTSIANTFRRISQTIRLARKKAQLSTEEEIHRQFTFDPTALKKDASMTDVFKSEIVEEDFNDIVDQDDERVEAFVSQELVGQMVESELFRFFILFVIVINSILIALQTYDTISEENAGIFSILDNIVLSIFICELLLKWYYDFFIFWRVGWNILDFVIIVALILGPTVKFLGSSRTLRILRVFRAFRSLRSVSALAGLSVVVQTIFQSIPDMLNIGLLLVVIMVVLSVAGVALFGSEIPQHFGDMGSAMFSLFICVTQDGWMGIYEDFRAKTEEDNFLFVAGCIYFFICILIGAFVFANLVVAVMVTNLDKAMKEVQEEKKLQEDTLSTKPSGEENEGGQDKDIRVMNVNDVIRSADLSLQNPLHYGDLKHLTHEKLEDSLLVMTALDDNIKRYKKIREELDEIFTLVWELNLRTVDDEDLDEDEFPESKSPSIPTRDEAPKVDFKRGDILSNLLAMERDTALTSTTASNLGNVVQESARLISHGLYGPMPDRKPSFIDRARVAKNAMKHQKTQKADEVTSPPPPQPGSSS